MINSAAVSASQTPHSRPYRVIRPGSFLIIFGYAAALLYPLVFLGHALYWGDIFLYFQPLQEFVQRSLSAGEIPLWNPYVLCGQPLVGNPQSTVIYPTTALLPFMSVSTYFAVDYLIHLLVMGVGTYLFVRRLCGDRMSGVFAAITFAGSGFVISKLQFPTMVQATAYLPWLLLLTDRLIEKPGLGYASVLAVIVALQILAGHAQLAYMAFFAAVVYFLSRVYFGRSHRERMRKAFFLGASSLLVGVFATAAQLLPMAQLFVLSTREKLTWTQANRFVLRPGDLIHFLAPYWHGNPARGDFWGTGNLWESCVYVGIVPLFLAAFAVRSKFRRRTIFFFTVTAVVSLWLALGKFGGLFWIAFYVVPGLASFHDPARFTFVTTFALAVLGGFGLRSLRDRGLSGKYRVALTIAAAANLWAFSASLNPTIDPIGPPGEAPFEYRPRFMASAPLAGEGRVFTALRDKVWRRFLSYSDYGPDSARYAHELTDTMSPNIGMRFGVEEASGYEPVPLRTVTEVDGLVRDEMDRKSPNLPDLLGLFNTTALLLPEMTRFRHEALADLPARGTTVLALRDPYPRAWLVRSTIRVDGRRRSLSALSAPDFDPRKQAIVSDGYGLGPQSSEEPVLPVEVETWSSQKIALDTDSGTTPAYLVLSATWCPGWKARVDGIPVPIERANHAFRGLSLPAGEHRIEMEYQPDSFRVGLFFTLLTATLTMGGLVAGILKRRGPAGK
jgi:hypothetical protein